MEPNPYQSPNHASQRYSSPPIAIGLTVLALAVAAELIRAGVQKTFIWGIGYNLPYQIAYGIVSLTAGTLVLERLTHYWRYGSKSVQSSAARRFVTALIWTVISIGLLFEVLGIVNDLPRLWPRFFGLG